MLLSLYGVLIKHFGHFMYGNKEDDGDMKCFVNSLRDWISFAHDKHNSCLHVNVIGYDTRFKQYTHFDVSICSLIPIPSFN
jgi:hypothetical protein